MNTKNKALLVSGTIMLVLTLMIALIAIEHWTGLKAVAFLMIIWAEIAFFGGMIFLDHLLKNHEKIIFIVPYVLILSAYSILSILISLIFINLLKNALSLFFILQLIIIAIAGIALTIFSSASKMVGNSNEKTLNSVNQVSELIKRLEHLAVSEIGDKYTSSFKKLSGELQFTDLSAMVEEDKNISEQISILEIEVSNFDEETSDEKIQSSIEHLKSLIAKRSVSVNSLKKGSI